MINTFKSFLIFYLIVSSIMGQCLTSSTALQEERDENKRKGIHIVSLESQIKKLKKELKDLSNKERVKEKVETSKDKETIAQLNQNLAALKNEITDLKNKLETTNTQYRQLQSKLTTLTTERNQLLKQKDAVIKERQALKEQLSLKEKNIKENQRLRQGLAYSEVQQLQKKNDALEEKVAFFDVELRKKADQLASLDSNYNELEAQYQKKEAQIKEKEKQITDLNNRFQIADQQLSRLRKSKQRVDDELHAQSHNISSGHETFFHHFLLINYPQHKEYLTKTLESHFQRKIDHTEPVYRLDLENKTNFHKYFDHKPNILMLIKLPTHFIAAFTEDPFIPKTPSTKDGLLINVSFQKVYYLVNANKKAITYDQFYMIFGNSEIRVKALENKLFSNFGINSSFYNAKGDKTAQFLGENTREMEPIDFEIHQVFFQ